MYPEAISLPGARLSRGAGFSLVEVSLALLVAGVGLLAVFSLFPSGLDAARAAADDTRAAQFGESMLATVRTLAPFKYRAGDWDILDRESTWNDVDLPLAEYYVFLEGNAFLQGTEQPLTRIQPGSPANAPIVAVQALRPGPDEYPDFALRYRMRLRAIANNPRHWGVTLDLWRGLEGPTTSVDYTFYTELYPWMVDD